MIDWRTITPEDAKELDLSERLDITAPLNEAGERCPWPWDPQQLAGAPIGMYHCPYCGAMVLAGVPHTDYAELPMSETLDITKAIKERKLAAKHAARARWLSNLSIEIAITWPGGILGWLCALVWLIAPVGMVMIAIRLALLITRRRK